MNPIDLIGWLATGLFVSSYFLRAALLRRMQMMGAVVWIGYGILLDAPPVIVANALVLIAAAWTLRRNAREATLTVPTAGRSYEGR